MSQQPTSMPRRPLGKTSPEGARAARVETSELLPGVYLDLRLGSQVALRPLMADTIYATKVVGLSPYEYFMVLARMPQDVLTRLQTSPALAARLNLGGVTYTFHTSLQSRVSVPASVLFLSHPETVHRVLMRRSRRVRVSIPCTVHGAFGDHDGMVVDMDRQGCRFNVRSHLASPLRQAQPGQKVVLNCSLLRPDAPLTTPLVLRRVEESQGRLTMGGQFEGLDSGSQRQVEAYMRRVDALSLD